MSEFRPELGSSRNLALGRAEVIEIGREMGIEGKVGGDVGHGKVHGANFECSLRFVNEA